MLVRTKSPPMVVRDEPPRVVTPMAFTALKSPVIALMPSKAMEPTVPVARAMDPVKVVQAARAVASPPFWMVRVALVLH